MEKIIFIVWKTDENEARENFCGRLLRDLPPKLSKQKGVRDFQVNVADAEIETGEAMMVQANTKPRPWGMVSVWVDSSATQFEDTSKLFSEIGTRASAYLVTESMPIVNTTQRSEPGKRTPGFSQIAVLRTPPRLSTEDWLDIWHGSHTKIAIDTQSTFSYVQNVVARPLSYAAPKYDAIVEECFPVEALSNPEAFYDAQGDKKKFEKHLKIMMDSCARFIDFDKIDVFLTSEYRFK
jgi:hypothetical protein